MDLETQLELARGSVTNLITKELKDSNLVKVETTAWIQFKAEDENGDGNIIRDDMVDKAFNSRIMEVFKGSNLNEIIEEMFAHMKIKLKIQHWRTADLCLIESHSWISISIS